MFALRETLCACAFSLICLTVGCGSSEEFDATASVDSNQEATSITAAKPVIQGEDRPINQGTFDTKSAENFSLNSSESAGTSPTNSLFDGPTMGQDLNGSSLVAPVLLDDSSSLFSPSDSSFVEPGTYADSLLGN